MKNTDKYKSIINAFENHLQSDYSLSKTVKLSEEYKKHSMVPLRGFMPNELLFALRSESNKLIRQYGIKRKVNFKITDNTPRTMTTIGQPVIEVTSKLIPALYSCNALLKFVSKIVGENVYQCPYLGERYVISSLRDSGDTHGWHWDDYTLAIVWILEAPEVHSGGFVQCVPNTSWDKENPDVLGAFIDKPVNSYALKAGDAYILKANTTMHRVYPLRNNARRLIINTTWATLQDLHSQMSHETNNTLFGGETEYAAVNNQKGRRS